jgi:hypothetical protein
MLTSRQVTAQQEERHGSIRALDLLAWTLLVCQRIVDRLVCLGRVGCGQADTSGFGRAGMRVPEGSPAAAPGVRTLEMAWLAHGTIDVNPNPGGGDETA